MESWSEHVARDPYDAIVSIGAFEHFAKPDITREGRVEGYREFFARCHSWLKPGGWMSLQTITYGLSNRRSDAFPLRRIFPESDLPRLGEIADAAEGWLELVSVRNDRLHYPRLYTSGRLGGVLARL